MYVGLRQSQRKWQEPSKNGRRAETEMNKLSPRQRAACDVADAQRRLCRDWLLYVMSSSPEKTRTKADLRAEAIERFKVSKSAFDCAWIWAIEETGNRHWYEPLPRSRKKTSRTLLV
jgi:hypothetical protein